MLNCSTAGTLLADRCPAVSTACSPASPWRREDGSCNNLQQPLWGSARTAFQRLLLPKYR